MRITIIIKSEYYFNYLIVVKYYYENTFYFQILFNQEFVFYRIFTQYIYLIICFDTYTMYNYGIKYSKYFISHTSVLSVHDKLLLLYMVYIHTYVGTFYIHTLS